LLQSDDANVYTLYGSGTTNPFKFFWKVMDIMEEWAKVPLFMTYRAVGSSTGQKEFTGTAENSYEPLNHFGAGDIPLTQARYDEMNPVASAPSKMLHIPFLVGPIAVYHSVPAGELPAGGIELDACLLSKMLRRVITTWDDPAIKAFNPTLNVPANQAIKVAHRTLGSSTTAGITEYLAKATMGRCEFGTLFSYRFCSFISVTGT
jgi:ABC-type phosphate transport system substrate-binding protein